MKDIIIKGACQHNLKNTSVAIPHDKLVVIMDVSVSWKSTLASNTLYPTGTSAPPTPPTVFITPRSSV
ncbi:MAG: hypothetical protein Q7T80_15900 [Methanoregula sp.]|nr:hypothetical protein [Methanoregula sp.]